jgi:hypothetical protein
MLDARPEEEAFGYLYNGAFVLESLPAALWCFLREPEDPEAVVVTAANGGFDADTVAVSVRLLSVRRVRSYRGCPSWVRWLAWVVRPAGRAGPAGVA